MLPSQTDLKKPELPKGLREFVDGLRKEVERFNRKGLLDTCHHQQLRRLEEQYGEELKNGE